jgi:hypothetical protein
LALVVVGVAGMLAWQHAFKHGRERGERVFWFRDDDELRGLEARSADDGESRLTAAGLGSFERRLNKFDPE